MSMLTVAPYSASAASMDFRRSVSAAITPTCSADMPDAQASAPCPLSSAADNSSSAALVGLS